jgi:hypothetical protein
VLYSWSDLHLIAYMQACRELSDSARGQVSTFGDGHRRGGELVDDALRLVGQAEEVLRLAVAAERAASTSWQEIGERLGISKQSTHERFAAAVTEISDGVLFPDREPEQEGALGWWACPDGLEDPEATVRRLDEWAVRHRESIDPDRGEQPVSGGLGRREDLAAIEAIGRVSVLAKRLLDRELPPGVSERRARRMLLEAKVEAFGPIVRRESGAGKRDAQAQYEEAWNQLVAWHREDLEPRLTVDSIQEDAGLEAYRFMLDDRPIAELAFTAEGSQEDTGWFVCSIDTAAFEASPDTPLTWLGEPWPVDVAAGDVDELVGLARREGRDAMRAAAGDVVQRSRLAALTAARMQLLGDLASDLAKGLGQVGSGGTAGPSRVEDPSSQRIWWQLGAPRDRTAQRTPGDTESALAPQTRPENPTSA